MESCGSCSCSVETTIKSIGIFQIIISFTKIVFTIYILTTIIGSSTNAIIVIFFFGLLILSISMAMGVLLIIAVYQENYTKFTIWLVVSGIIFLLDVIGDITKDHSDSSTFDNLGPSQTFGIIIGYVYCLGQVYIYRMSLEPAEQTETVPINNAA